MRPRRSEVWQINFDPQVGAEIQKKRPAVILSEPQVGILPLRIVVPITDWKTHYAGYTWFVELPASDLNGLKKHSGANAFQVKSISLKRFIKKMGELTADQTEDIAAAVALCVGYSP